MSSHNKASSYARTLARIRRAEQRLDDHSGLLGPRPGGCSPGG